ncbi:MAG: glycogen/starch/alpha-glucan phosphorylase, partial [Nanoarchaeota archaeon]
AGVLRSARLTHDVFLAGFARRFVPYKRAWLPLADGGMLRQLPGDVQLVYAGKAHRNDGQGQGLLSHVLSTGLGLDHNLRFGFVPDYGIETAKLMIAGSDLWVVAAVPHEEASGTSPMKAGFHGNKTLSTDGGFWPEVSGRHGELGYTFGGTNEAEEIRNFYAQLGGKAMADFSSEKMKADRRGVLQEFLINFSAIRMAREYGWVYGFERERPGRSLEQLVAVSA